MPKIRLSVLILIFCVLITGCVRPVKAASGSYGWAYSWTRTAGSAGEEFGGQSVAADDQGNVFITGGFSYTVNFDGAGGTDNHTANGDYADIFITKYNANGTYGWTRTFGGPAEDYGGGAAVDSLGNVYVTGYFQGTADFDDSGGTDNHSAIWGTDIFITKYNADGSYGWTRTIGNTGDQLGYAITTDSNDDVIAMGYFTGTVNFDATGGTDNHNSANGTTFITKYHNDGSYAWTRTFGKSGQWWDYDITTDADNYIYATSFFTGTADFDGSDGVDVRTSNGAEDIFVTRLSADGTYKWTKTIGGTGTDRGSGVTTDANGFVYVTGYFSGTANFDTSGGTDNRTASGGAATFVLKMKESGKYIWTKTWGGDSSINGGSDIVTDSSGNLFVSGSFVGDTDFDTGPEEDILTGGEGGDSFITKYNADGTYGWTRALHSTSINDTAEAFAIDVDDHNAYITGFYIGTVDFDGTAGVDEHSSDPGNFDFFLVRYTDDVPNIEDISAQAASDSGQISWNTDEATSTQVEYGLTDDYGNTTTETDTGGGVTDHQQDLTSLHACAHYYYRVLSADSDGNKAISDNRAFNASGCLASSVVGGTAELIATTGGSVELSNGQSTATLLIPSGAAAEDAAFQINILDSSTVPQTPAGLSMAKGNFYNLLAVGASNDKIDNFSDPVYFTINYGPDVQDDFAENTLDVFKFDGTSWNKQNCTVNTDNNTITCALGGFSVYGVLGQQRPGASQSGGLSPAGYAGCSDGPPDGIPDLFQINVSDNQATLYFTPVGPDNRYFVSFSKNPNAEEHGAEVRLTREGVQNLTVNYLKPNTNYYFKIRGQNGCMPGGWSTIVKAATLGKSQGTIASYYKYGLIRKSLFYSHDSLTALIY